MKYRVGKKQSRVILDDTGHKVAECLEGKEEVAQQICDLLNKHGLVSKNNEVLDRVSSCYAVLDEEDNIVQLYQTEEKADKGLVEFQNSHEYTSFYVDKIQIN